MKSLLVPFGAVKKAAITILVDNTSDMLLKSTPQVQRYTQTSGEPLLAEHGFAVLVDIPEHQKRILFDAGFTQIALPENMRLMGIDPNTIDQVVLSHGHADHFIGMSVVVEAIVKGRAGETVPLVMHPAARRERWRVFPDGRQEGPFQAPVEVWQRIGAELLCTEQPYRLSPGCWMTGEISRQTFERAGTPAWLAYKQGGNLVRDWVEDDQALLINIEDHGLVILAGCAHSGILNTIHQAQEISGVERVHAILGGFHLGPYSDEEVDQVCEELARLEPALVAPSHCTGFRAIEAISRRMPDSFVFSVVGTTYHF